MLLIHPFFLLLKIEELTQQIPFLGTFNHCYFFITTTFPHNTNFRSMLLQRQDTCSIFSRINVKQMPWKCKNIEYGNEGHNNFSYLCGCTRGMRTCYKKNKSYPDKKGEHLDVALAWILLSVLFLMKILTHLKLPWRKRVLPCTCVCVYTYTAERDSHDKILWFCEKEFYLISALFLPQCKSFGGDLSQRKLQSEFLESVLPNTGSTCFSLHLG